MKCSLADDKSLSARIENLGNLGREQLDQAWGELFESDRPRRVCGGLLIKALAYRCRGNAASNLSLAACSSAGAAMGRNGVHRLSQPELG